MTKRKKVTEKKRSKIPKKLIRLANWDQFVQDSTVEEEESQRQKAAVKASVV